MSPAHPENWTVLATEGAVTPRLLGDVTALAAAAEESDGNPPLSEQTLVTLRTAGTGGRSLLTLALYAPGYGAGESSGAVRKETAQDLAGVAVVVGEPDGSGVLELAVHPGWRNRGAADRLVREVRDTRGFGGLSAWSHGNHGAAAELAARYGFSALRELWRMRLSTPAELPGDVPAAEVLPAGLTLRAFVPGQDEDAWLRANKAAFAHHPEQGNMTRADLDARMAEPWFDPAGFLLAVDGSGALLGFHWTKVHPGHGDHPAIGEVYVVGVTPEAQGTGLGKALTVAGINHLQSQGLHTLMLYVDADNAPAVSLYRRLGFTRWDVDVMYASRPGS